MANKINQIEIDSIIYDLQDKDAKAPFTGTKAEVEAAIAAGEIKEGDIVNITDDVHEGGGGGGVIPDGVSNIVYLTQEQYDALPDDKLTDDIEYRITDEGTDSNADNVGYNNATSGLSAMNVQDAIDELSSRPSGGGGSNVVYLTQEAYDALPDNKLTNGIEYRIMDGDADETARNISYDNNESGLEAVNVQQAIDKLVKGVVSGSASNTIYLTQAEYDGLPESKLTDGIEYFITDTGVMGAANNITYDNSQSGLEAINVQTAIDEVQANLTIDTSELEEYSLNELLQYLAKKYFKINLYLYNEGVTSYTWANTTLYENYTNDGSFTFNDNYISVVNPAMGHERCSYIPTLIDFTNYNRLIVVSNYGNIELDVDHVTGTYYVGLSMVYSTTNQYVCRILLSKKNTQMGENVYMKNDIYNNITAPNPQIEITKIYLI